MLLAFRRIQSDAQSFGWSAAVKSSVLRFSRRIVDFHSLRCMVIKSVPPEVVATDARYECRFISIPELRKFAPDSAYELSDEFLDHAERKGDECYAILDGEKLASYGWYSHSSTKLESGWRLRFDQRYIYMFKGFTLPAYRGQRLHAVGMGRALNAYVQRGRAGIVSYVEAQNLSSLKSCYRMGYADFGKVWLLGRRWSGVSAGCTKYGFSVARGTSALVAAEVEMGQPLPVQRS